MSERLYAAYGGAGSLNDEDDDGESFECCGGEGCAECDSEWEPEVVRCCGTTQQGMRCQITSDSVHSHQRKFADAAKPLTYGGRYCGFHTHQAGNESYGSGCPECDGEGCTECCSNCDGEGCSECEDDDDVVEVPAPVAAALAAAASAVEAADDGEVEVAGSQSLDERLAELGKYAIDVDQEECEAPRQTPAAFTPGPPRRSTGKRAAVEAVATTDKPRRRTKARTASVKKE